MQLAAGPWARRFFLVANYFLILDLDQSGRRVESGLYVKHNAIFVYAVGPSILQCGFTAGILPRRFF